MSQIIKYWYEDFLIVSKNSTKFPINQYINLNCIICKTILICNINDILKNNYFYCIRYSTSCLLNTKFQIYDLFISSLCTLVGFKIRCKIKYGVEMLKLVFKKYQNAKQYNNIIYYKYKETRHFIPTQIHKSLF